jgi:hypothetical protein
VKDYRESGGCFGGRGAVESSGQGTSLWWGNGE